MLFKGSGEFNGTSIKPNPANTKAWPTLWDSAGVMPRKIAIKGKASKCSNNCAAALTGEEVMLLP
jgi:hypothetical protein